MRSCLLILVVVLGSGACKKSPPPPTRASCEVPSTKTCEDYESRAKLFTESRRGECKQVQGVWRDTPCPTAELAASCTEVTKKWTRIRRYYKGAITEEPLARLAVQCGAYGTWTAGTP
ncbi:MAG: hypothetical protein H0T89_14005 [Deltaproteobacteria bacterium]|nr:hypothetical protein [Deltaproteobacteria bacterium]MDQ3297441.1 hypothetical protein [Myxococcota bacterium]